VNIDLQTDQENENSHSSDEKECKLTNLNITVIESMSEPVLNFYNDSREFKTMTFTDDNTFEQKRILFTISECIFGNLHAISQYLSTLTKMKLFLHKKNKTENTTLIMTATEKSHEMMSLLLQHDADANTINNDKQSALMKVAL